MGYVASHYLTLVSVVVGSRMKSFTHKKKLLPYFGIPSIYSKALSLSNIVCMKAIFVYSSSSI
jgi:hypothetical protein